MRSALTKMGADPAAADDVIEDSDANGDNKVTFEEFAKAAQRGAEIVALAKKVQGYGGADARSVHSYAEEECKAFSDFINARLADDENLSHLLPIATADGLFSAVSDGMLLCRLLNEAAPGAIDERAVNRISPSKPSRFHVTENQNLAISAAKGSGIKVVNVGAEDIIEGQPHLILGLVWQMVKMALLSKINLRSNPFLIRLLLEGETLEDLLKLPPEQLLMRWVNYHLAQSSCSRRLRNFGSDVADSEIYAHLLQQIDPGRRVSAADVMRLGDKTARAQQVVSAGRRLGSDFSIRPKDIVSANEKLNLAFVAGLFNACPALEPLDEEELKLFDELEDDDVGDSREERAFRLWINSLGIDGVYVDNLYDGVRDGLVLLSVMDHVQPGVVEWSKVNRKPGMVFKQVENVNYAIAIGKGEFKFSLVGVAGSDIAVDGSKKLSLALIWQLMRAHLVSFLATLKSKTPRSTDSAMVRWANETVEAAGYASRMKDFGDKSLADGLFLLDLLTAVERRCVNRDLLADGATDESRLLNAKYAIACARKLGCALFCLPEDLVEVRPKMVMSFVASVMAFAGA